MRASSAIGRPLTGQPLRVRSWMLLRDPACKCMMPSGFTLCISCKASFTFEPDPGPEEGAPATAAPLYMTKEAAMAHECLDPKCLGAFSRTARFGKSGTRTTRGSLKSDAKKYFRYRDGFEHDPKVCEKAMSGHCRLIPGRGRVPPYKWDPLDPLQHTIGHLEHGLDLLEKTDPQLFLSRKEEWDRDMIRIKLADDLFARYGNAALRSQDFWNSNGGEPETWVKGWFDREIGADLAQERATVGDAPFHNTITTKKYSVAVQKVDIALRTPDHTNALRLVRKKVVERFLNSGADAEASGGASAAGVTSAGPGGEPKRHRERAKKGSQGTAAQPDEEMGPVASSSTHEETSGRSSNFPWKGSVGRARSRPGRSTDGASSSRSSQPPTMMKAFPKTRGY